MRGGTVRRVPFLLGLGSLALLLSACNVMVPLLRVSVSPATITVEEGHDAEVVFRLTVTCAFQENLTGRENARTPPDSDFLDVEVTGFPTHIDVSETLPLVCDNVPERDTVEGELRLSVDDAAPGVYQGIVSVTRTFCVAFAAENESASPLFDPAARCSDNDTFTLVIEEERYRPPSM